MIRGIARALLCTATLGGLLLCGMGLMAPRTLYRSADRYCLRLRVVDGGAALLYDGGPEVFQMQNFSVRAFGVVVESRASRRWHYIEVAASAWILMPLLCTYPCALLIRGPIRRHRRGKRGLCLKCGYNLTGNMSGVCPECGTKVETR